MGSASTAAIPLSVSPGSRAGENKTMNARGIILGLIVLALVVTVLAASVKLRATPKYDRIQVGMNYAEVNGIFEDYDRWGWAHCRSGRGPWEVERQFDCDEGAVVVKVEFWTDSSSVTAKSIARRGPLERLAWLAGWR